MIVFITVCLNAIDALKKTCRSFDRCEFKEVHHFIKDGGSTDGSKEFIEAYCTSEQRSYISSRDDGIYAAMNEAILAIERLDASHVFFLNAGDVISAQMPIDLPARIKKPNVYYICNTNVTLDGTFLRVVRGDKFLSHQGIFIPYRWHSKHLYRSDLKIIGDRVLLRELSNNCEGEYLPITAVDFELGGVSNDFGKWDIVKSHLADIYLVSPSRLRSLPSIFRVLLKYILRNLIGRKGYFYLMNRIQK